MKKIALALAASIASAPAMAGVYINAESNGSYTGNNFTSPDGADGNTDFSGKLGGSVAASEKFDIYGEVSFLTNETTDTAYGTKIGAKFKF